MRLVGVGLLIVGSAIVWRTVRTRGPYRAGPWPGLSPAGAGVLLSCALLLAGGQLVLGDPLQPLPDLPLLGILALGPMALATRLVRAPGAASAVCGAYLLPRALLSLVDPSVEPPPLLLVPALAFDVTAWLRASDVANLGRVLPGRRPAWRQRPRVTRPRFHVTPGVTPGVTHGVTHGVTPRFYAGGRRRGMVGPRRCGLVRAAVAGAVFGGVLAAVESSFAVLLGADLTLWSGPRLWLAGGLTVLGGAVAGLLAVSGRDTAA